MNKARIDSKTEKKEPKSCEIRMDVSFCDLDPMQVVWHGNYFKYFDKARFALFAQYGVDLYEFYENNQYLFPLVRTSVKYVQSLRYGDEFICKAILREAKIKIVLDFEIRRVKDNKLCVKAQSEQVTLKMPEMEMMFHIPEEIQRALESK